jgi:hypothetical protein
VILRRWRSDIRLRRVICLPEGKREGSFLQSKKHLMKLKAEETHVSSAFIPSYLAQAKYIIHHTPKAYIIFAVRQIYH